MPQISTNETSVSDIVKETNVPEPTAHQTVAIIGGADGPTTVLVSTVTEEPAVTTTTVAEDGASPLENITPKPQNFVDNLHYMGIGMAGIFIVIAVIIGATALMNRIFSGKK